MLFSSYSVLTVFLIFWIYLCKKLYEYVHFRMKIEKLPGPRGNFFLGNTLQLRVKESDILPTVLAWWDEFESKGIFRIHLLHETFIFLTTPENIEKILTSSKHIEKSNIYRYFYPWLGLGLLTSSGTKWKTRRKQLTPTFHFKILEDFVEIFNKHSETLVRKLSQKSDGRTFNIFPFITLCTLDVICETAMGTNQINAQENDDSDYVTALYKISRILQHRIFNPLLHNELIFRLTSDGREHSHCLKILHGFTKRVIAEKKAELKAKPSNVPESKRKRKAFLDLLLEASADGHDLSDDDLRAEVDTFMFEGHDTTSSGISWTLYLLGLHPKIQDKVHKELDDLFGREKRPLTTSDLQSLKYLECVIKESMRIYPPVPFIARLLKEDFEIGQYKIPKGCSISLLKYGLHRNPNIYPNPQLFDPDRFLPENTVGRHPFAYIPFSAGPRNCIGQKFALMEEKIILSHVLRSYRLESVDHPDQLKILSELILRPENGFNMKLSKRH